LAEGPPGPVEHREGPIAGPFHVVMVAVEVAEERPVEKQREPEEGLGGVRAVPCVMDVALDGNGFPRRDARFVRGAMKDAGAKLPPLEEDPLPYVIAGPAALPAAAPIVGLAVPAAGIADLADMLPLCAGEVPVAAEQGSVLIRNLDRVFR